jgi:hypothetical protein
MRPQLGCQLSCPGAPGPDEQTFRCNDPKLL